MDYCECILSYTTLDLIMEYVRHDVLSIDYLPRNTAPELPLKIEIDLDTSSISIGSSE